MENMFKGINNFIKGIKNINPIQKKRFIVNPNEETAKFVKNKINIPEDEQIKMVLDDSLFKNLDQIVVFTDKKIYWTIKNASMKAISSNTELNVNGQGVVDNKLLSDVSIFSTGNKDSIFIYILSNNIQLIIPFKYFEIANSLTLAFYEYISNYCGGYKPNSSENDLLFKKISKKSAVEKTNVFADIFNGISYMFLLLLLVNIILKFNGYDIITNEKIICGVILAKIISILFGNKKSMYTNLLVFILTYNFIKIPVEYNYEHYNIVYIIYAGIILLFNIFDFDKIFKYLILILTIISVGYMVLKYFNLWEYIKF
jgi:hypothetical protein